jgi:hypothetical protein
MLIAPIVFIAYRRKNFFDGPASEAIMSPFVNSMVPHLDECWEEVPYDLFESHNSNSDFKLI